MSPEGLTVYIVTCSGKYIGGDDGMRWTRVEAVYASRVEAEQRAAAGNEIAAEIRPDRVFAVEEEPVRDARA